MTTEFPDALVLRYKRIHQKVNEEYPFEGTFEVDSLVETFPSLFFRQMVQRLYELLNQYPHIHRLIFQRTDREGIVPLEVGPHTQNLLRTNPEAAYIAMNTGNEQTPTVTGHAEDSTFGRLIYLSALNGKVEDPLTGKWVQFAYGPNHGWMIRGEGLDAGRWLKLATLVDDAPAGVEEIARLAFTRWALIDVEELLKRDQTHFYLPRPWNLNGPWITREELQYLYNKSKENAA